LRLCVFPNDPLQAYYDKEAEKVKEELKKTWLYLIKQRFFYLK